MRIGIYLLWVKHKVTGGMESYVRNLLDGLEIFSNNEYTFVLYLAKDNYESFSKYLKNDNFEYTLCNVESMKVAKRIVWENLYLNSYCVKDKIEILFTPVYSKPLWNNRNIKYVTTIHDLQALHFPNYFSKIKYTWLKYSWKRCADTSHCVIAISNFVKEDIITRLDQNENKIKVIYNPIVKSQKSIDFNEIKFKYKIEKYEFYYSVSAMLPHKNLKTILMVVKRMKEINSDLLRKLLISGVGGKNKNEVESLVAELGIEDYVILTGFVSNEERDCLYKNAKVFLFPSIFEGFGMPPVEALSFGTPVVITDTTCLKEVTKGKAIYVEKSFSIDEWIEKIETAVKQNRIQEHFNEYSLEAVTRAYLEAFKFEFNNTKLGKEN